MKALAAVLLCLVTVRASTTSAKGFLVGANCFQTEQSNVNPTDINMPTADDVDFDIRACYPRANKTRSFMVVLSDGEVLALDAAGNAEAARLVDEAGKRRKGEHRFAVNVTGTVSHDTIHVSSISAAR